MTVKEYLKYIEMADELVQSKRVELDQLEDLTLSITAQMGGERVQTSMQSDKMGSLIAKIVDLQNEIISEIDSFLDEKQKRIKIIEQVQDVNQYRILHRLYIRYMSLKAAAVDIGVSYDYAKMLHGDALEYIRLNITTEDGERFTRKNTKYHQDAHHYPVKV